MEDFMAATAAGPTEQRAKEFVDWVNPPPFAEQITLATDLIPDVAAIAAKYITGEEKIGLFGPNFWQARGVDAGVVLPIDPAFYDYWYGPDPVDPTRRACDTHHWPVWIPEGLSLATLAGAGLSCNSNNTGPWLQHKDTPTGGGYYTVMRKEVLGRNLPEVKQIQKLNEAGYPGLAQAADVAAVLFAMNQHNGSRWLGDDTGEENRWTYTRCVERVAFGKSRYPLVVGGSAPSGVNVNESSYGSNDECVGVAALRKF
jgi:hypothetical protein